MINDPVLLGDWHVVAWSKDIPEGAPVPVRLLGENMVLWRTGGKVMAWQDLCVHRGSKLSLGRVENDTLICPYHGWTYNEDAQCVRMPAHPDQTPPAKARVKTYHAVERYGAVWVCPGEPLRDVPPLEEWEMPGFRVVPCGPYPIRASGPRAIENFLDVAHFPFVHEGLLGDESHTEINDYEVITDENGVTAENITVWQPNPDGTGIGADVSYTYRVYRALTAYFEKTTSGPRFSILFNVSPVEQVQSVGYMWVCMNYGHDMPDEEVRGFQDEVFAQDLPIVESQWPERLPLDLQAELHLRSDRTAIAYRRWLNDLGLTFGTS
jgi:phenylpropionate dioxygenase-like ring-hydroxylating dioxygenase large terminal subunit